MLEALEDDEASAFAHDEAAAVLVERARCVLRIIVVVHAECLHRSKTCDSCLADGCFRAASDHDICLAFLDDAEGIADAVRARRAGRDDARRRTVELVGDGDLASGEVRDHHRDEERADAVRALVKELLVLSVHRLDTADARADVRADAVTIFLLEIETCILDCQLSRSDSELCIAVHALGLLLVDVVRRLEALDFACNLCTVFRCIETGDLADAVLAFHEAFPECVLADANWGDGPQARNYYAFTQNNDSPLISCILLSPCSLRHWRLSWQLLLLS